jgi:hypothetical protein
MTKETQDGTRKALDKLAKWLAPGSEHEGISFQITRLTDPLTGGSLIGGGDCSIFTPSGKRGSLESQGAVAFLLDGASEGLSQSIGVKVLFDLNKNVATVEWSPSPGAGAIRASNFALALDASTKKNTFFFHGANASDGASYAVTFALL